MAVTGEFGGQYVQLDNAATETTLQRLVEVAQAGFGSAGSSIRDSANAADALGRSAKGAKGDIDDLGSAGAGTANSLGMAGSAMQRYAGAIDKGGAGMMRSMRTIQNSPFMIADTFVSILERSEGGIQKALIAAAAGGAFGAFTTVGDKLTGALTGAGVAVAAAAAPAITGILAGMFVRVLKDTTEGFNTLQKNGAILGGSMLETRLAAHGANLTMGQFANVMGKASAEMSMFGGQTRRGAQMFGDLNKAVSTGEIGRNLLQLGIGFEDMGVRTAEMIAHLTESGINFETNAVSVAAASQRVRELAVQQKQLAALNGTTIEQEKEKQRMARKDAQLNAIMLGMGEKEREGIQQLTAQFPQFSSFIKETVAFGGPVTKGALMQQAQMGATTEALGNTIQQVLAGGGQGAIDAFKELQNASPALQADLRNQAELVKLSLVSQNEFITVAANNFQSQFELFNKSAQRVMDSITEDFNFMADNTDNLTKTIGRLQTAQQELTIEMTKSTTELLANSKAVQDIMVGTTEIARDTLKLINNIAGVRNGLDVQVGRVGGANTTQRSTQQIPTTILPPNTPDNQNLTGDQVTVGTTGSANANTAGAAMGGTATVTNPGTDAILQKILDNNKRQTDILANIASQ